MRNATYPLLALTLLAATTAGAQGEVTAAGAGSSPRLVAVHFQALPPDEFEGRVTTHVTLPPPRLGVWDSVTAAADTGCLTPLSISRDTEEGHLLLELAVRGESAALAPGESCAGTVVLRFSRGDALEAVAVGAAFYRPEDPVIVDTALRSQYSVDRISRGEASQVELPPPATYLELLVANDGDATVRIERFPWLDELRPLRLQAYRLPGDAMPSSLMGLEPLAEEIGVELGPGETFRVAVVIDPAAEIAQDAGAAAVQPALIVEEGGARRTLRWASTRSRSIWVWRTWTRRRSTT